MTGLLLASLISTAFAADLQFSEAVQLALTEGAQARIVAAEAGGERAGAHADAAWAGNPELSVDVQPLETTVLLSVPIDVAALGRGSAVGDAVAAANVRERAGRSAVASAAGAAYLDAMRAGELAGLATDALALADRLKIAADARYAAGEVPRSEHVLLLAEAASALDAALSIRRDAEAARRVLGVLVGTRDAPVASGWPDLDLPGPIDQARLSVVLAADLEARAALKRLHAARLSLIPALSLSGGWVVSGDAGPVYGASLTLPLFAPGASRLHAARATLDGKDAEASLARLDAEVAVADAGAELDIASRVATAWDIPGLDGAPAAAARRYEAGESSLVAFVGERDLALGALQSAVDARWRLQRARLAIWELAGEVPVEVPR